MKGIAKNNITENMENYYHAQELISFIFWE